MAGIEPTHGDILVQLGELKGQVATLITLVGQKREDINNAFSRISVLEKLSASHEEVERAEARIGNLEREVAKWAGICLAASVAFPFMLPYLQRGLGDLERPAAAVDVRPHG